MRWDLLSFSSGLWICCIIFSIMIGFLFWFCSMQVILLLHLFPSLVFVVELKPWSWSFEEMLHVSLVPIFFLSPKKTKGPYGLTSQRYVWQHGYIFLFFFHSSMVLSFSFSHLVLQLEKRILDFVHVLMLLFYCATALRSLIARA